MSKSFENYVYENYVYLIDFDFMKKDIAMCIYILKS